jgi:hypothetical protein
VLIVNNNNSMAKLVPTFADRVCHVVVNAEVIIPVTICKLFGILCIIKDLSVL